MIITSQRTERKIYSTFEIKKEKIVLKFETKIKMERAYTICALTGGVIRMKTLDLAEGKIKGETIKKWG